MENNNMSSQQLFTLKQNCVAVVTGGSRGIGASSAIKLASMGATIALVFGGDLQGAKSTADTILSNGGKVKIYQCDVADYSLTKTTVDKILSDFLKVDILVNNAGVIKDKLMLQMNEQDWDSVVDINLKGSFNMIKHLYSQFVKNKSGRIINVTSVSGLDGNIGQANYSSSKAGLVGLTKSIAKELGSRGITCNAVAPGFVDTDMTSNLSKEIKDKAVQMIPLKRMGKREEIASCIAFLASEQAGYVTGQVLRVDGGLVL
ncbi:MAG: 3-oxoacyl-[acyl-carrier-protein] reductase [Clostridiales bacterium]|jgi:3-oxoacyl-[acyl-carrier protein] reductase|nr:3-oxoacyl-[acyl-carrier-protein] reductase [Clostridiales bacterium]